MTEHATTRFFTRARGNFARDNFTNPPQPKLATFHVAFHLLAMFQSRAFCSDDHRAKATGRFTRIDHACNLPVIEWDLRNQNNIGAPGNTATRIDSYAVTGGTYVYNTYPEVDGLFSEQVNEQNPRVRTQILQKIQQIIHERVMFAPIYEYIWPSGVGPRVEDPALLAIPLYPWSAPLEDVRLKQP